MLNIEIIMWITENYILTNFKAIDYLNCRKLKINEVVPFRFI